MIRGADFLAAARAAGFDMLTGVPCSYLTPLMNAALADAALGYLSAANEGEAVAIAAGAWLAGRRPIVMMQNSGLGNAISPLTSLIAPSRIGVLAIVTWRGQPGVPDEPQHALMGQITQQLLALAGVSHEPFATDALARAAEAVAARRPYALVQPRGAVADEPLVPSAAAVRAAGRVVELRSHGSLPPRVAALEHILAHAADAAIVSTTGKCSRELFTIADRPAHFYLVGAMGCASAVGLGVAHHSRGPVVVIDGDGALLMRLETLATIGSVAPRQLIHLVLDNGVHDSTGGQPTAAPHTDFAQLAATCGYPHAYRTDSLTGLATALDAANREPGPHLIHVRIAPGSLAQLGRPTVGPADVAARFREFLAARTANS